MTAINNIELNIGLPVSDVLNKIASETGAIKWGEIIAPRFMDQDYFFNSKIEGLKFKIYPAMRVPNFRFRFPSWVFDGEVQDNQGESILRGEFKSSKSRKSRFWFFGIILGFPLLMFITFLIYAKFPFIFFVGLFLLIILPCLPLIAYSYIGKKYMRKVTMNFLKDLFADKLVASSVVV